MREKYKDEPRSLVIYIIAFAVTAIFAVYVVCTGFTGRELFKSNQKSVTKIVQEQKEAVADDMNELMGISQFTK